MPNLAFLQQTLINLVPLVLSLSVHEWAHAASAHLLGDDTAAREGRLTLDPTAHIDPVGTILLPILGVPFGWARPVPVNPLRFRRGVDMRTGMMLTAAAGPLSNVVLAIVCCIGAGLVLRVAHHGDLAAPFWILMQRSIAINVGLALFNVLPIYPLDGSRVVARAVPLKWEGYWDRYCQVGPWLLVGFLMFRDKIDIPLFGWILRHIDQMAWRLVSLAAGA